MIYQLACSALFTRCQASCPYYCPLIASRVVADNEPLADLTSCQIGFESCPLGSFILSVLLGQITRLAVEQYIMAYTCIFLFNFLYYIDFVSIICTGCENAVDREDPTLDHPLQYTKHGTLNICNIP